MSSTLLAIDPAAEAPVSSTGWARVTFGPDSWNVAATGAIPGGYAGFVEAVEDLTRDPVDVVVCEKFIKYKAVADVTPLLVEGVVRYIWPNVVLQPSSVMQYVSDDFLKRQGVYSTAGHHRDANSALKHALAYLRAQRHIPLLRDLSR